MYMTYSFWVDLKAAVNALFFWSQLAREERREMQGGEGKREREGEREREDGGRMITSLTHADCQNV